MGATKRYRGSCVVMCLGHNMCHLFGLELDSSAGESYRAEAHSNWSNRQCGSLDCMPGGQLWQT